MHKSIRLTSSIVALVGSLLTVPSATAVTSVVQVQAGAVHPANPNAPYDYTRFYPDVVKVHRGQTVRWNVVGGPAGGFHTITFSKNGPPAFFRPDDVAGSYARPEESVLGSPCGRTLATSTTRLPTCVLNSSTRFLSSGVPPLGNSPFEINVDLAPGKYAYFCTSHPTMKGVVEVVKPSVPLPTQKQIDAQRISQIRSDSAAADALFRADQKPVSKIDAQGHREWQVLLGDSTVDNHVTLSSFMPTSLDIATGDTVRYVYRDRIINELHTVTFPPEVSGSRSPAPYGLGGQGLSFACDFDDPSSGLRGVPGPWGVKADCPANLEVVVAPWMITAHPAPNNQVLTRATFHDSGFLVPPKAPDGFRKLPDTGRTLPRSFEANFPAAGNFVYECNFHLAAMTGNIKVS